MIKTSGKEGQFGLCICLATSLLSLGCVYYALPVVNPPSQERVNIVAKSPESYVIRIKAERSQDYPVPPDGRVSVGIPAYRPGCRVSVTAIKVSNGYDPLKDWTVEVREGDVAVRSLSVRQLSRLRPDAEGFRVIKIG